MPFPKSVREQALLASKRYCCYCGKFCGINIEVHHIVQEADGGENTFENAIPLCFDCHANIGSYNPRHPKGTKYSTSELKEIRDSFYKSAEKLPRKAEQLSEHDKKMLKSFKNDFTDIMEYIIETDISASLVDINLSDDIDGVIKKWNKKKRTFELDLLNELKIEIIVSFIEFNKYLSPLYFRELNGQLYFRNESWEEGERLREDLQPNSLRIRRDINNHLQSLYKH